MGYSARHELLAKGSDATFLREMIGFAAQRLMELETETLTGAVHGERSSDRQVQRNGYRKRDLHTRAGTMELRIPRLRKGTYFPGLPVLPGAAPDGGESADGRHPGGLRAGRLHSFRRRVSAGRGDEANTDGRREVLGMTIGNSEAEPFWTDFLRTLTRRGLRRVKLVISDAHEDLKAAIAKLQWRSVADQLRSWIPPLLFHPLRGRYLGQLRPAWLPWWSRPWWTCWPTWGSRRRTGPAGVQYCEPGGKRGVTERSRKSVKAGLSPSPNTSRASAMGDQAGCAVQPACRSAANTMARRARRVRRRGACRW